MRKLVPLLLVLTIFVTPAVARPQDHWVVAGRQKRALVYFRKALELKPDFAKAQYGVVKAYIQGVDFAKDESKIVDEELAKLRKLRQRRPIGPTTN